MFVADPMTESIDLEPVTQEIVGQVEDFERELEMRQEKKNKYKVNTDYNSWEEALGIKNPRRLEKKNYSQF